MRSLCLLRPVLAVALATGLAGALVTPDALWARPHAKHMAREEVITLENQWVRFQSTGDTSGMEKLLSPDFLGITASGDVVTKTQQLDRMKDRDLVVRSLQISDVRVKLLGQHAAIVTSLAQLDATAGGHPLVGSFRYTHVYQKLASGMWSLTNFEATRVPQNGVPAGNGPRQSGIPPE